MVERRLRSHRRLVLVAIVALAAGVRLLAFVQAGRGPALSLHRWQATDMAFVDEWAKAIVAGDWLGRRPLHPYHPWHQELVDGWLATHPETAEELAASGATDRSRALWNRWSGGTAFHHEPLYAYLVAATYALAGPDPRAVFLWQLALGAATTGLLVLAVRRVFGHTVATLAGVAVALAGPLVYHELLLLPASVVAAAGVLLVHLTVRARTARAWRPWSVVGVALGVALLAQTVYVPYGIGLVAALLGGRRLAAATAVVAGAALVLAPVVARNVAVGAPPLALAGGGGIGVVLANAVDFRPGVGLFVSEHTRRIMGETDGRLVPAVRETLRTHADVASVLRMLGGKLGTVWHWHEIPNNGNFYFFRLQVPVLRVLPVTFFLLAPLALVGLVLGLPAFRRAWPLYLLVGCHVALLLVFYTVSWRRLPLLPGLVPFAALTVASVARSLAGRRFGAALLALAAAGGLALSTARPLPGGQPLVGAVDYWAAYLTYYRPRIEQAEHDGDFERAVGEFRRSLELEPEVVRRIGLHDPPRSGAESDLAAFFGSVHDAFARALVTAGHAEEAQREAERGRELTAVSEPAAS